MKAFVRFCLSRKHPLLARGLQTSKRFWDEKSCLLFDAFGVINVRDKPIKKALEYLNTLKSEGTPF